MQTQSVELPSGSTMMGTVAALRESSHMEKKSPSLRVLVVDDEALIRWSVAETLLDQGHQVVEAPDGRTALQVLSEVPASIDVVLLDYRLPDSDDLTLLSRIRRLAPESQVILITAYGTPEVVAGAQELGVFRVVNKPVEMHDVAALVEKAHASRPH